MGKPELSVAARKTELLVTVAMIANKLDGPEHSTSVRHNVNTTSITIWTKETKKAFKIIKYLGTMYKLELEDAYVGRTNEGSFIRLVFKDEYLVDYWTTETLDEVLDDYDDYSDPFVDEEDEDAVDEDTDCSTCPFRFDCIAFVPDYVK